MTHGQKILARAAGLDYVEPGMTVFAEVDKAITHELVLPVAAKQLDAAYGEGFKIWDREKLLVTVDHTLQIPLIRDDQRSREMAEGVARFVAGPGAPPRLPPPGSLHQPGHLSRPLPGEGSPGARHPSHRHGLPHLYVRSLSAPWPSESGPRTSPR